ncbi:MAG: FliH/SctL family protein [Pseudomonadota bacterium]
MSESATDRWQAPAFPDPESMPTASDLQSLQEAAYKEAYEEAYAKGLEAGHSAGLKTGSDEVQAQLRLLQAGIDALSMPMDDLEEVLEQQLAQMVIGLVGRLFRRQLEMDPDSIVGLVREAVTRLPIATQRVHVHIHPDDAPRLDALGAATDEDSEQRLVLVQDASMTRGGCVIRCAPTEIDARVETRIEQIAHDVIGDQRG